MTEDSVNTYDRVGPVLQAGTLGNAVVAAIRDLNQDVLVMDRGAYLRVLVPISVNLSPCERVLFAIVPRR